MNFNENDEIKRLITNYLQSTKEEIKDPEEIKTEKLKWCNEIKKIIHEYESSLQ